VTTEERTGHGFAQVPKSQLGEEEAPLPREREGCALPKSVYGASAETCWQRTSEGLLPVTNGTRVSDKQQAHESECTACARNLRVWVL
jgi:hypothetical protein